MLIGNKSDYKEIGTVAFVSSLAATAGASIIKALGFACKKAFDIKDSKKSSDDDSIAVEIAKAITKVAATALVGYGGKVLTEKVKAQNEGNGLIKEAFKAYTPK